MQVRVLVMAVVLAVGAHLLGATSADAQLSISRFTVDGGGGAAAGGAFTSSGTAGQPDAGVHTGGAFTLSGGFWFGGGGGVSGVGDGTDEGTPSTPEPVFVFQVSPLNPNPMTDQTALSFQLPEPTLVRAEVFDASGRLVRVLVDGFVAAGPHQHLWDRRDGSGGRVPAGIYFVRFDAGGRGSRQKVVVLS